MKRLPSGEHFGPLSKLSVTLQTLIAACVGFCAAGLRSRAAVAAENLVGHQNVFALSISSSHHDWVVFIIGIAGPKRRERPDDALHEYVEYNFDRPTTGTVLHIVEFYISGSNNCHSVVPAERSSIHFR